MAKRKKMTGRPLPKRGDTEEKPASDDGITTLAKENGTTADQVTDSADDLEKAAMDAAEHYKKLMADARAKPNKKIETAAKTTAAESVSAPVDVSPGKEPQQPATPKQGTKPTPLYYANVEEGGEAARRLRLSPEERESRKGDIYFGIQPGANIPDEVLELQSGFTYATVVVKVVYKDANNEFRRRYLTELLSAARLLSGPTPNAIVAARALEDIKDRLILREGANIKAKYLESLAGSIFRIASVPLFAAFLIILLRELQVYTPAAGSFLATVFPQVLTGSVMLAFASIALWLSFASRKQDMTFDDLVRPEEDLLKPNLRVFYVFLFTLVLAVFSTGKVIPPLTIGDFNSSALFTSYMSSAIFGFVCGFSEKLLVTTVSPHVSNILKTMSTTK